MNCLLFLFAFFLLVLLFNPVITSVRIGNKIHNIIKTPIVINRQFVSIADCEVLETLNLSKHSFRNCNDSSLGARSQLGVIPIIITQMLKIIIYHRKLYLLIVNSPFGAVQSIVSCSISTCVNQSSTRLHAQYDEILWKLSGNDFAGNGSRRNIRNSQYDAIFSTSNLLIGLRRKSMSFNGANL